MKQTTQILLRLGTYRGRLSLRQLSFNSCSCYSLFKISFGSPSRRRSLDSYFSRLELPLLRLDSQSVTLINGSLKTLLFGQGLRLLTLANVRRDWTASLSSARAGLRHSTTVRCESAQKVSLSREVSTDSLQTGIPLSLRQLIMRPSALSPLLMLTDSSNSSCDSFSPRCLLVQAKSTRLALLLWQCCSPSAIYTHSTITVKMACDLLLLGLSFRVRTFRCFSPFLRTLNTYCALLTRYSVRFQTQIPSSGLQWILSILRPGLMRSVKVYLQTSTNDTYTSPGNLPANKSLASLAITPSASLLLLDQVIERQRLGNSLRQGREEKLLCPNKLKVLPPARLPAITTDELRPWASASKMGGTRQLQSQAWVESGGSTLSKEKDQPAKVTEEGVSSYGKVFYPESVGVTGLILSTTLERFCMINVKANLQSTYSLWKCQAARSLPSIMQADRLIQTGAQIAGQMSLLAGFDKEPGVLAEGTVGVFLAGPAGDAVGVVGVVAAAPADDAVLGLGLGLALDAGLVDAVFADGAIFDLNVPAPQCDRIPLLDLEASLLFLHSNQTLNMEAAEIELLTLLPELVMRTRCDVRRAVVDRLTNYSLANKRYYPGRDYQQHLNKLVDKMQYTFTKFFVSHGKLRPGCGLSINLLLRRKQTGETVLAERFHFRAELARGECDHSNKNLFEVIKLLILKTTNCALWNHFYGEQRQFRKLADFIVDYAFESGPFLSLEHNCRTVVVHKRFKAVAVTIIVSQRDLSDYLKEGKELPLKKSVDPNCFDDKPKSELSRSAGEEKRTRKISIFEYYNKEDDITFISTSQEDEKRAEETFEMDEDIEQDFEFEILDESESEDTLNCRRLEKEAERVTVGLAGKKAKKGRGVKTSFYQLF